MSIVNSLRKLSKNKSAKTIAGAIDGIELGGGSDILVVKEDRREESKIWYDKTWQQVKDALPLVVLETIEESADEPPTIENKTTAIQSVMSSTSDGVTDYFVDIPVIFTTLYADSADGFLFVLKGVSYD